MTVKEFFAQTLEDQKEYIGGNCYATPRPRVVCKDGFSISIQANNYAYCEPREDNLIDYMTVELGYPNKIDELIEEYSEEPGSIDTIYGYVPVTIVDELLEKHGGIAYW